MNNHSPLSVLRQSITSLFIYNPVPRPGLLLAFCSFCMASPLLAGVLTGHLHLGLTACIGALLGLYSPSFPAGYRAKYLLKLCLPFSASFAIGLYSQHTLYLSALSLIVAAGISVYLALRHHMRPPASFFFIMVCCLAKANHVGWQDMPVTILAFCCGSLLAITAVFTHDYFVVKTKIDAPTKPAYVRWQPTLAVKAVVIGSIIGVSYYTANIAGLDNPYWVPVTVAAIMQGQRMTDFWQRSLHRATGTLVGMLLSSGIYALSPSPLFLVALLFVLSFLVEMLITKNYALACIFITPLTVILADSAPSTY